MTYQEILDWMAANFDEKLREFGLGWWRVDVEYVPLKGHTMEVETLPHYEKTFLRIDPRCYEERSEADFIKTLEHEILHITQAPFDNVQRILDDTLSEEQRAWMHAVFKPAFEQQVRHLERTVAALRAKGGK